jgi:DNA repair exonuclease SbcCD ATPase subunit
VREDERHTRWSAEAPDPLHRSRLLGRLGSARFREAEEQLAERIQELDERAAQLAVAAEELDERTSQTAAIAEEVERRLRVDSAELDAREAQLDALTASLERRDAELTRRDSELDERSRQLGAVELQRAALERREEAIAAREREMLATGLRPVSDASSHLLFVPGERYSLAERVGPPPPPGDAIEVDSVRYLVARLGASPLPMDDRPCAFLEAAS